MPNQILLSLENRPSTDRGKSWGEVYRWVAIGTEVPVMVFLGAYIGYEVGKKMGFPYEYVGLTVGALLGFAASMIAMLKMAGVIGAKKKQRIRMKAISYSACF